MILDPRALGRLALILALAAGAPACAGPTGDARPAATAAPAAAPAANATAEGKAWDGDGVLRLLAWNVEWMWDGRPPEDGDLDFPRRGRRQEALAHMEAVAEVLRQADADLVHLGEVEDSRTLDELVDRYLEGQGYEPHFVAGRDTATGQDVALLSRLPVSSFGFDPVRGRSGSTRKGVSKHYVATLEAGELKLGVVGLHFLARPRRQSRIHPRQAQADAVRRMAARLVSQGRELIVWGDFNDYDPRVADRRSSRPITEVLRWVRELDPDDPGDDLANALARVPEAERVTSRHGTAIDHVLLSAGLYSRVQKAQILRQVKV
ncbi:MAG: endonuclease/exonuclease/phosphatase family protein, partial [Holophagales bacterium]|nr:endonuclease/exonuclease/phosphatase family protein [Holophagales bacterium]